MSDSEKNEYPDKYPETRTKLWTIKDCDSVLKNRHSKQTPINIDTHSLQECHTLCNLEINYLPNECNIYKHKEYII